MREGELVSGVVNGWNFGDGHFHSEQLLEAIQERCHFKPGEVRVVAIESQPAHIQRQHYRILDAADGLARGGLGERCGHDRAPAVARRLGQPGVPGRRDQSVSDAWVVGAGPNGLAGAVELARNGLRSRCSKPRTRSAAARGRRSSPCPASFTTTARPFTRWRLPRRSCARSTCERHGLEWRWPEIDLAHPLDDGSAAFMARSIDATAEGLGADGAAWKRLFGGPAASFDSLLGDLMQPMLHFPRHPIRLTRFGIPALAPATLIAKSWKSEAGKGTFRRDRGPRDQPADAAALGVGRNGAHLLGPRVRLAGRARRLAGDHRCARGRAHGARRNDRDGPPRRIARRAARGRRRPPRPLPRPRRRRRRLAARRAGRPRLPALPPRARARSRSTSPSRAACRGRPRSAGAPAPSTWSDRSKRRSAVEAEVNAGRMPERPYVLVGQQYLADPEPLGRRRPSRLGLCPRPERLGGRRDRDGHQARSSASRPAFATASSPRSRRARPSSRPTTRTSSAATSSAAPTRRCRSSRGPGFGLNPYATGIPGVFMCSASTPPGAGVHGMNGFNAARAALSQALAAAKAAFLTPVDQRKCSGRDCSRGARSEKRDRLEKHRPSRSIPPRTCPPRRIEVAARREAFAESSATGPGSPRRTRRPNPRHPRRRGALRTRYAASR